MFSNLFSGQPRLSEIDTLDRDQNNNYSDHIKLENEDCGNIFELFDDDIKVGEKIKDAPDCDCIGEIAVEERGRQFLEEDSGIQMSFHEKVSADSEHSWLFRSFELENKVKASGDSEHSWLSIRFDSENKAKSMDCDVLEEENNASLKEAEGKMKKLDDILCVSLLKPLDSELDDSIDIIPEMDVSLNESLDVNDILSAGEKVSGTLSPEKNKMKLSEQSEKLVMKSETCHQFRPAFNVSPQQPKNIPRGIRICLRSWSKRCRLSNDADIHTETPALPDHSYSKMRKHVSFQVKSSQSKFDQPLFRSTPVLRSCNIELNKADMKSKVLQGC